MNQAVTHDGLFVLATLRSGVAPEPITALWKDGVVERIEIADLSAADTARLVDAALNGPVDGATQRVLFDRSRGNPLFVRELVLAALETGLLGDQRGLWRLDRPIGPVARLSELIDARLADLGDREREALEIVAFAEPAQPELLARLIDATDLESLETAGLINMTRRRLPGARYASPTRCMAMSCGPACRHCAPCGSTISSPTRSKTPGPARTTTCDSRCGDSKAAEPPDQSS